ncbi:MAG: hydroxymethylglutaryl-CoA lyase [Bacteroidota bacterium]
MIHITECPRDAMQGIDPFIPTALKTRYLNQLLKVGFDTLDFGSFVSPKAIPQLADTAEVLAGLDLSQTDTKLLAIVANRRGAEAALSHPEIAFLGYPFSISETFQLRNTRKNIADSFKLVKEVQEMCVQKGKKLLIYISMAFGNHYGDPWSPELAEKWVHEMVGLGIDHIAMADTTGSADKTSIHDLFGKLLPRFPEVAIGAHFHAHPSQRLAKIKAAWDSGCRRFDVALQGFGGCPFAEDELVGNIATESLLTFCQQNNIDTKLDTSVLTEVAPIVQQVFYPN